MGVRRVWEECQVSRRTRHDVEHRVSLRIEERDISNAPLLRPVQDFWGKETSPVARFLSSHYALGIPADYPKIRGNYGVFQALGVFSRAGTPCSSVQTWAFIFSRYPELKALCLKDGAFFPRMDDLWPVDHPVLEGITPFVWAGSYHPHQPSDSPFLKFDALDELTAWTIGLTNEVDEDRVKAQLDMAMQVPGFRIWSERRNILPMGLPMGCDPVEAMEYRFEIMDSPLHFPLLKRGRCSQFFREEFNLGLAPSIPFEGVPFSNGKKWPMLCPIPADRWTLKTSLRHKRGMKQYRDSCPTLVPPGTKNQVEVAGVWFRSIQSACLYFRVPWDTCKSRMRSGKPLEMCLGLRPLNYRTSGGYVRGTTYENHWNSIFARTEDRK